MSCPKKAVWNQTGIMIQARMGSERLPGKILMPLEDHPMLEWVIRRCQTVRRKDLVIVVTTFKSADDSVEKFCRQVGIPCFRGSEEDVLHRYVSCSEAYDIDTIVRITSDCPFISPAVIDECLDRYFQTRCDYVNNSRMERTFPRGLDVEVCSRTILKRVREFARSQEDREHVTFYIYDHPDQFKIETVKADSHYWGPHMRLTVDVQEDLELVRLLAMEFKSEGMLVDSRKIIAFLKTHPDFLKVNKDVHQKIIQGRNI
jgi:spore coat polysaccharide biosynthesis protein SpsF